MIKVNSVIKRKYSYLFILIILLSVVRLFIIFFGTDTLFYSATEELACGAIAKELIEGTSIPFYHHVSHKGGNLVIGILITPFFIFLGKSLFAVKLASLSVSLCMLIILYLLLYHYFNFRTALIASILFIFLPPKITYVSLTFNHHFESILFSLLIIFIFYKIFFSQKEPNSPFLFSLWGLISGFSVFFSWHCLFTLFSTLLLWYAFDKNFFKRRCFFLFLLFFIVGDIGEIYWYIEHICKNLLPPYSLKLHVFLNISFSPLLILNKAKQILTLELQKVVSFGKDPFDLTYYCILIYSFCFLFWINRTSFLKFISAIAPFKKFKITPKDISPEFFFLFYPIIFLFIYIFSGEQPQFDYLLPLLPFLIIIIASSLDKLWNKNNLFSSIIAITLISILFLMGIKTNLGLISLSNDYKEIFRNKGYSYSILIATLSSDPNIPTRINELIKFIDKKVDGEIEKYYCYEALGVGLGWTLHEKTSKFINERIEEYYRKYCLIGLGWYMGVNCKDINKCLNIINKEKIEHRPYYCNGLSGGIFVQHYGDIDKWRTIIEQVDERYWKYCYEGLGWVLRWKFGKVPRRYFNSVINKIDEEYHSYFIHGLVSLSGIDD